MVAGEADSESAEFCDWVVELVEEEPALTTTGTNKVSEAVRGVGEAEEVEEGSTRGADSLKVELGRDVGLS